MKRHDVDIRRVDLECPLEKFEGFVAAIAALLEKAPHG